MALVASPYATPVVAHFVNALQRHISTPAITYPPTGQGTKRRRERELAKLKANKAAEAERKKRLSRKASTSDVTYVELAGGDIAVEVFGQRVGTIKQLGDKAVLFDNAAVEVGERSRARDLKKAAAALYVGQPQAKQSRQVRRRLERKGW